MPPASAPLARGFDRLLLAMPTLRKFPRPSLLLLTAGVAGLSAIANVVSAAAPADPAPTTRLGASIQQSVRERDAELARQRRALDLREQAARASEARLKADIEARQTEGARGSPANADAEAAPSEPYDELARIYQTMKPARAAPIFERLDLEVQTQVARRMRERAVALIMSNMSANGAVQLSMSLAGRRVVPAQAAAKPVRQRPATAIVVDPKAAKPQGARQAAR